MERQRFRREREGISLKRITAGRATLAKWARILPPAKDQIFLPAKFSRALTRGLTLERLLPGQSRKDWNLLERSWFAYLAGRAAYRIVLPAGNLDRLPLSQRQALKLTQIKIKNPALVASRLLPASLREEEAYTWLTAEFFRRLRADKKIAALRAWDQAGKLTGIYPRITTASLTAEAKKILKQRRLLKLANTFAAESGPNCFATAAYAITGEHLHEWLHAEPFLKIARKAGYRPSGEKLKPGDILICRQKGQAIHAALYLGGYVFEKPGQDFYEPYRLARWSAWQRDWSHCQFESWTKR